VCRSSCDPVGLKSAAKLISQCIEIRRVFVARSAYQSTRAVAAAAAAIAAECGLG
jgi:hypothetical protein